MRPGLILLGVLAFGLTASAAKAAAPPPGELKKLHAVLIFDTNEPELGPGLEIDRSRVRLLLRYNIPPSRLNLVVLDGKNASRERILETVKKMKVASDDALLCFYGGHGGRLPDGKHFLALTQGKLFRDDLLQALEGRRAGLTVLLTDCCSNMVKIKGPREELTEKAFGEITHIKKAALRSLFFQSRGVVDITAATLDRSYGDNQKGGLFTRTVCGSMMMPDSEFLSRFDKSGSKVVSWHEFFPGLQKDTEKLFNEWRDGLPRGEREQLAGKPQSPMAFQLGSKGPQGVSKTSGGNKVYAVVNLVNRASRVVKYEYRWSGEKEWKSSSLKPGEQKSHALPVSSEKLPHLEARIEGIRKPKQMEPGRWSGSGKPNAAEGKTYELKARE